MDALTLPSRVSGRFAGRANLPLCWVSKTCQAASQMVKNSHLDQCQQKFWKVLLTGWPGKCFYQKRPQSLGRDMPMKDRITEVQ